jgi:hypothetical protein
VAPWVEAAGGGWGRGPGGAEAVGGRGQARGVTSLSMLVAVVSQGSWGAAALAEVTGERGSWQAGRKGGPLAVSKFERV